MADIGNRMIEFIGERDTERKGNVMNETLGCGTERMWKRRGRNVETKRDYNKKSNKKKLFKTEHFFTDIKGNVNYDRRKENDAKQKQRK